MRRFLIVLMLVVTTFVAAAPAEAGIVCRVMDKLGYENVKECEVPL